MGLAYTYLVIAIFTEVAGTLALKASEHFTKLGPSIMVVVGYGLSTYLFSLVLKTLPVGITYAIWAGAGITLVAGASAIVFKQVPDMPAMLGMGLIISGIIVINLFSKTI